MNRKGRFIIVLLVVLQACSLKNTPKYVYNQGNIFGTYFHIVYEHPKGNDLIVEIEDELHRLDMSLSTYKKESVLSKVNTNQPVVLDDLFVNVYKKSKEISELTGGAFDPTVAPLVNAWGFGFKKKEFVTAALIDSLMDFVGYEKSQLTDAEIRKTDKRLMLDFSAIAKGYAVDVIGDFLAEEGCENYMVEIGGEVVAHGKNKDGVFWRIGINEPNDNEPVAPSELQAIVSLQNKALATSGNYRNFYIEDGVKYAHTIDPKTGYPVNHSLLSATVLANDCMTADALATALMVLGVDKAKQLVEKLEGVQVFLIYDEGNSENEVIMTEGFEQYIVGD